MFYPRRLKSTEMLGYYSGRLPSVEVNTTFYRSPALATIQAWAASVPPSFRFAVKAHRRITHNRRMPNLEEAMATMATLLEGFGDRLGPVLFQLPPTAPFEAGRIERIAAQAPMSWRLAFQFRHRSWHTLAVADTIERMGAALCHGDGEEEPGPLGRGRFVYLRLRRDVYSGQRLAAWGRRIERYLGEGRDVYAYVKHEALGPLYAERLRDKIQTGFRTPVSSAV